MVPAPGADVISSRPPSDRARCRIDAIPNRVALFVNTFARGTDLSNCGLWKDDRANDQGYFTQTIDAEGIQHALYRSSDFDDLPVSPVLRDDGSELPRSKVAEVLHTGRADAEPEPE